MIANGFEVEVRMEGFSYPVKDGMEGPSGVKNGSGRGSGGGSGGGVGPPPKWGSRFGVFLGVKKWSKMVKKGAGRRGKQKCVFRG